MSVISVELHSSGTDGDRSNDGKRAYNAYYLVTTNTVLDQTGTICDHFQNAGNLPKLGDPYVYGNDSDQSAICSKIAPRRQQNSQTSWIVTLSYETPTGGKNDDNDPDRKEKDNNGNLTNDPTQWRERWDTGYTQRMIPVSKAVYRGGMNGANAIPVGTVTPCVNSCLEPFESPRPEKEHDISTYRRSFYKAGWDGSLVDKYMGRVNANAFDVIRAELRMGFHVDPYCLRMKSIAGTLEWINNFPFWNWNLEWWIDPLTWRLELPDMGINRRAVPNYATGRGYAFAEGDFVDGRARLVPILDADGNPVRTNQLLDGAGGPLITGAAFPGPVILIYSIYEEIDLPEFLFGNGAFPL